MRYAGGKGVSFRQILNLIPPHQVYIETHLGGGAVLRNKRPADRNIGIDIDADVIYRWSQTFDQKHEILRGDAHAFLKSWPFQGNEVIYSDPPYFPSTRRRHRVYRYDYTEQDHEELLGLLTTLSCPVLISGYDNQLYANALKAWNSVTFSVASHTGARIEKVWFNFDPPASLHDSRYLGKTFREREIIKRRLSRLRQRIDRLSPCERESLLQWMNSCHVMGEIS